jgi:hypothetical protein
MVICFFAKSILAKIEKPPRGDFQLDMVHN